MKRLSIVLLLSILLLTGCLNPISVSVVEEMYTNALLENQENAAAYFTDEYLAENPPERLTEELAAHARSAGGVKSLNGIEVTKNRLNPELVKLYDEMFKDEWYYVAVQPDEKHIVAWIVLNKETQYEIAAGEKLTVKEYNEYVLK